MCGLRKSKTSKGFKVVDLKIDTVEVASITGVIAFYEKVIKVKADVAAYLINCFPSA